MIGGMRGAEFCAGLALMVASGCHVWRARPVTAPAHGPAPWAPCGAGLCRGVLRRPGAERRV